MRLTSFYSVDFGTCSFRVKKLSSGNWSAKVQMRNDKKWKSVTFAHGQIVHCPTKRAMVNYLRYAYEGKEESA